MAQAAGLITLVTELKERLALAMAERGINKTRLAGSAGVGKTAISNYLGGARKMPRKLVPLARALGVDPEWLAGKGPREPIPPYPGDHPPSVQEPLAGYPVRLTPPVIEWGAIMPNKLPSEFQTHLPDQAMAPAAPKGTMVIFVTGVPPEPGDWVLIHDRLGNIYFREYKMLAGGVWEAHASNHAFLPLHSERDGLQVIAIFDGMRGRKALR